MICIICDTVDTSDKYKFYYGKPLKLVGGYNTTLCDNHANEWHEFINDHPTYLAVGENAIKLHLAGEHHDEQKMAKFMQRARRIKSRLYDIGKDWIQAQMTVAEVEE